MPLFEPSVHEPLAGGPWDDGRVRAAIRALAVDADAAFDETSLTWPVHPHDEDGDDEGPFRTLYLGSAGVVWALDVLARAELVEPAREWAPVASALHERYLADAPELGDLAPHPAPGLLFGEAGILLVAHRLDPAQPLDRLAACIAQNAESGENEVMWGAPGTMLAAQELHARTGDERWAELWRASADVLWERWAEEPESGVELWTQELYGRTFHFVGPVHGFAGNVFALERGRALLDPERAAELDARAVRTLTTLATREDGCAQWPPTTEPPNPTQPTRTQFCHGAPGMVATLARLAPGDDAYTELLRAGGELTWRAGPLAKGANVCHGTAGNGYAFLALFERTGDELWLERARAFGMHALAQVAAARAEHGAGRHTLWTGDLGAAIYLRDTLDARGRIPTMDGF